jgi:hypothetical protein
MPHTHCAQLVRVGCIDLDLNLATEQLGTKHPGRPALASYRLEHGIVSVHNY